MEIILDNVAFDGLGIYDVDVEIDIDAIVTEPYPHLMGLYPSEVSLIIGNIDIVRALTKSQAASALKVINTNLNTPRICQKLEAYQEHLQNEYCSQEPWY